MPNSRRTRWRRMVYKRLPRWMRNHDFEIFAAVLTVFAGLPLLFGQVASASVESLLPLFVVKVWAFVLTLGGILIMTGVFMTYKTMFPQRAFWMRIEALGLTALAYACYLYSICIIAVTLVASWPAAMLVLAFGLTCHTRELAVQLQLADFRSGMGLDERS